MVTSMQEDVEWLRENLLLDEKKAWFLARNVQPRHGQGTRTDLGQGYPEDPKAKVSPDRFAELVDRKGFSGRTIRRWLQIWDYAARELRVLPPADELSPGDPIDWPPDWGWNEITIHYEQFMQGQKKEDEDDEKDRGEPRPRSNEGKDDPDLDTLVKKLIDSAVRVLREIPGDEALAAWIEVDRGVRDQIDHTGDVVELDLIGKDDDEE